uniref:Uncharacterized protein n=1 Tax=Polytomella parva TaxID=51329 RepID=A0A6U0USR7_9CHLO|mmetsp:Transcript_20867/g.37319  ORF Transcript_20867/g.37319 Transcript_20867/m.37319 type:complete len:414 (+) Transcript_20867:355-1596(+)|eukprot:CAMPEP_0175048512 /NCGR_PEP_ID=MMETSP0052_2-20121109/6241_1 /TAXON_ID=51329 ORGANISM="Polytomella parva, Strain SAG 63-3" /NCGR_SAMPLE_ID=MMETSP0052_2 /ASSEMBLY_ACC=CAM_ASM_000194 /LENGTH=413 /DNA_ID=CAMNT_0016312605 /DNA_START=317 /DNA_END=1558 /DNA_ORIENTATION=+
MGTTCGHPSKDVGIAFLCSICAGLAIVLGTCITFITNRNNRRVLSATLAFASGVIIYIAVVDLYIGDGIEHFEDYGLEHKEAFCYASLVFFGGFPICAVLSKISHWLLYKNYERKQRQRMAKLSAEGGSKDLELGGGVARSTMNDAAKKKKTDIDSNKVMSTIVVDAEVNVAIQKTGDQKPDGGAGYIPMKPTSMLSMRADNGPSFINWGALFDDSNDDHGDGSAEHDEEEAMMLAEMGLLVCIAIVIHNFPEGLLTFIGYIEGFQSAVATAFAIIIHNIPEGMVVAMPMFYSTGSKWKSIGVVSLMGLSVPMGSLIGLSVMCGGALNDVAYAILFALTAGILTYVVIMEVWPKAVRYDPCGKIVPLFFSLGMGVMCLSIVAINYSEVEGESDKGDGGGGGGSGGGNDYFSFR